MAEDTSDNSFFRNMHELVLEAEFVGEERAADLDRRFRTLLAERTRGMSLLELAVAYFDWASHLAISPGRSLRLAETLVRRLIYLGVYSPLTVLGVDMKPPARSGNRRLSAEAWQRRPFNVLAQSWLVANEWLQETTAGVRGVRKEHRLLVGFVLEQCMEALSPANTPLTNPEVLEATRRERGRNLLRGVKHFIDDRRRKKSGDPAPGTENFRVGREVAVTPGKVIYQNRLIELIQYSPATEKVAKEPVLIVPAWIMKYYILDLSPHNSLVRYLVDQGKTVFMISWKNPTAADRDLSMDDYLDLGILAALDVVNAVMPRVKVHATGYCIGGTLLYIAAARLAQEGDNRLGTLSVFAAQMDFSEAGEIRRFLGESIFSSLEALMYKRGYLGIENMGGAFQALRSGDLIWGPMVDRYFMGKEASMNDLMAWNADGTRMPYRMHSEYLRKLYLDNDLAEGRFKVKGQPVFLADIETPMFVVGTVTDHVAPWKSVYKIHRYNRGEITFALTTGGHNAGIACGPSHPRRKYQLHTAAAHDKYLDPEVWQESVDVREGSWWPAWNDWLDSHSNGTRRPPAMGAVRKGYPPLRDAPGDYVLE